MKTIIKVMAVCLTVVYFSGCNEDSDYDVFDPIEQFSKDSVLIQNYIDSSDLDFQEIVKNDAGTGIYISITEDGTEETDLFPTISSDVTCRYNGMFLNGTSFDSTKGDDTIGFSLSGVIAGWQAGLTEMTKGDKATLLIPSYYGYGYYGYGSIPSNTVLMFDVELVSFE